MQKLGGENVKTQLAIDQYFLHTDPQHQLNKNINIHSTNKVTVTSQKTISIKHDMKYCKT